MTRRVVVTVTPSVMSVAGTAFSVSVAQKIGRVNRITGGHKEHAYCIDAER